MEYFISYRLDNGKSDAIKSSKDLSKLRKVIKVEKNIIRVRRDVSCIEINQNNNDFENLKFLLEENTTLKINACDKFDGIIEVVGGKVEFSLTDSLDSDDKITCSGVGGTYKFYDGSIQIFDAQSIKMQGYICTKIPTIFFIADDILFSQSHMASKNVFLDGKNIRFVDSCFEVSNSLEIKTEDLIFNSSVIEADTIFKIQASNTSLDSEAVIVNKSGSIEYNDFKFLNNKHCYLDGSSFNRRFAGGSFVSLLKAVSDRLNSSNEELILSLSDVADNDIQKLNDELKEKELSIAKQLEDERAKVVRRANDNYNAVKQSYNINVDKVNQDMEVKKEAIAKRKVKSIFNKTS